MAKVVTIKATKTLPKRYQTRWEVDGKTKSETFAKKWEADEKKREMDLRYPRSRKRRKVNAAPSNLSVEQVAEAYFEHLINPAPGDDPVESSSLRGYKSIWRSRALPHVQNLMPRGVSDKHYHAIYKDCVDNNKSADTRNQALRLLQAVLTHAKDIGVTDTVVTNPIKNKKTKRETQIEKADAEKKFYTPDEVYTMLHAAESLTNDDNKQTARTWQRYRPLLMFLVYTGARISEARAFPREDWNPNSRDIHIKHSAPEKEGEGTHLAKTSDSVRKVPLNPELVDVMEAWINSHNRQWVFGTKEDTFMNLPNLYSRMLKPLKDRCDVLAESRADARYTKVRRDRAFHAFRHHYASWLVSEGATMMQLKNYMGHSKASFTMDVYGHLFEDSGDELALRMTMKAGS